MTREMWTYKGQHVYPADRNSAWLRWECFTPWGRLRADTKASMKELISLTMATHGITSARDMTGYPLR